MTSARVVVTPNSPSQDYTHPDDHNLPTHDMIPGLKLFTLFQLNKVPTPIYWRVGDTLSRPFGRKILTDFFEFWHGRFEML